MSNRILTILVVISTIFFMLAPTTSRAAEKTSRAAENKELNADILRLALDWEHIKFEVQDKDLQEKQMAALAGRAASLVQKYQNRPEAVIWLGILVSEQASMASENGSPFKARRPSQNKHAIFWRRWHKPIRLYWTPGRRPAWVFYFIVFPVFRSASAIKPKRGNYWKRPLPTPRPALTQTISTATSCTNSTNFRKRRKCFSARWLCRRIRSVRSGIRSPSTLRHQGRRPLRCRGP